MRLTNVLGGRQQCQQNRGNYSTNNNNSASVSSNGLDHVFHKLSLTFKDQKLQYSFQWFEHFPASRNHVLCNDIVKACAIENQFELIHRPYPFKFGEDFGWFSRTYKTAMFGIGAGLKTPPLHSNTYDFPDEIIQTGMNMFKAIIKKIMNLDS